MYFLRSLPHNSFAKAKGERHCQSTHRRWFLSFLKNKIK
jgi:hypothetical protein